ncbi:cysteine dioxygenase family protein [Streptomyces sp. HNM0663]|uniref:Cysteine dioxygenase family protein n=1 Tax=Streptomyces chengmaiensis TaxID=3040919 RepID=A0ABT6HXZ7_9ACTN|nr:cysteine dioxygenase family protein [Streptomyces chengmaiensis]MDH2393485.1 cysteine dioxygenase family protein [Streptomyces chengmaiensis]
MTAPMASTPHSVATERLTSLVAEIREVVGRGMPPDLTARLVAERLAPHLAAADLLTPGQRAGDPRHYRQHLLHAEHDGGFSIVALVWLPGQRTPVHDHVAWCTTGVHEGIEHERRYRLVPAASDGGGQARLARVSDAAGEAGTVAALAPPGDIHRVWNPGPGKAISLHVYGADISRLGTSVRRVYRLPADL